MVSPPQLTTGRAVGQFFEAPGKPLHGTVTFTASISHASAPVAEPNPFTVLPRPQKGVIDSQGFLSTPGSDSLAGERGVVLVAVDNPELSTVGWHWVASIRQTDEEGNWVATLPSFPVHVLTGEEVDLSRSMRLPVGEVISVDQAKALADAAERHASAARGEAVAARKDATTAAGAAVDAAGDAAAAGAAVAQSRDAALAAEAFTGRASDSADAAKASADAAKMSAGAAQEQATTAVGAAQAAATEAAQAKTVAGESRDAAAAAAGSAAQAADAAASSATAADSSAANARQARERAESAASSADRATEVVRRADAGEFVPNITIGTVNSLPSTDTAKATVRGTPENPILDLDLVAGVKGEAGGWNLGVPLQATSDLNTMTAPGLYWNGSPSSAANPALNYPPALATSINGSVRGVLEVKSWSGSTGAVEQQYTTIGTGAPAGHLTRPGVSYNRYLEGGLWSKWNATTASQTITTPDGFKVFQEWDDASNAWVSVAGPGGLAPGQGLGTLDLNTVLTPGIYYQNTGSRAIITNNYPVATHCGVLTVTQWGTGAAGEVVQEYSTYPNQAGTNTFGIFTRAKRGELWSPWRHIPTQRVDTTAGRVIYTWDDINNREQIIYGDTGWRNVASSLTNGFTGTAHIRRQNGDVSLRLGINRPAGLPMANDFFTIPPGFESDTTLWSYHPVRGSDNSAMFSIYRKATVLAFTGVTSVADTDVNQVRTEISWSTTKTWPTELPGTSQIGTIPNN